MQEEYFVEVTVKGLKTTQIISRKKATILANEGRARWVSGNTIELIWNQQEFRQFILTRDNNTCYYCGKSGTTIDHKLPRTKGGMSTPVNCVCACFTCNNKKGSMTEEKFKEAIKSDKAL